VTVTGTASTTATVFVKRAGGPKTSLGCIDNLNPGAAAVSSACSCFSKEYTLPAVTSTVAAPTVTIVATTTTLVVPYVQHSPCEANNAVTDFGRTGLRLPALRKYNYSALVTTASSA